jgi:hypothetical protein
MKMRGVIAGILVLSFLSASFPAQAERIATDAALNVPALTDQEAALLASQSDTLPAGAADAGILVVAIATVYCVVFWYVQTRRLNL